MKYRTCVVLDQNIDNLCVREPMKTQCIALGSNLSNPSLRF